MASINLAKGTSLVYPLPISDAEHFRTLMAQRPMDEALFTELFDRALYWPTSDATTSRFELVAEWIDTLTTLQIDGFTLDLLWWDDLAVLVNKGEQFFQVTDAMLRADLTDSQWVDMFAYASNRSGQLATALGMLRGRHRLGLAAWSELSRTKGMLLPASRTESWDDQLAYARSEVAALPYAVFSLCCELAPRFTGSFDDLVTTARDLLDRATTPSG